MKDRELLELAAQAAGIELVGPVEKYIVQPNEEHIGGFIIANDRGGHSPWNPITDYGDRYRLISTLKMAVDFDDCTVWKRLPNGTLIQEFWGGECGDESHAIVRAAAEIGKAMP